MAPPLVAAHQRNRRLGTEDVAHQVDAEDLVPARRARLVDLLVFADAGIVDEDVEAPELLRGTVDEGEACGLGTNVSLREGDLGAGGLELGRHALAALAVPIAECHARALGDETPDRRLADPRCPARHRCDLAVEPSHVRHLSLHCETSHPHVDLVECSPSFNRSKPLCRGTRVKTHEVCPKCRLPTQFQTWATLDAIRQTVTRLRSGLTASALRLWGQSGHPIEVRPLPSLTQSGVCCSGQSGRFALMACSNRPPEFVQERCENRAVT